MSDQKVEKNKKLPNFKCLSSSGKTLQTKDLKGKKTVLYFYPKDNTPGCTTEAKDFAKLLPQFAKQNCLVFGVSRDSVESHCKFIDKQSLNFELLSDPNEELCELFDVMKMKQLYGKKFRGIERSTFVIDEDLILVEEWRKISVAGHAKEVLDFVKALSKAQKDE